MADDHRADIDQRTAFAPGTFGCHEALHMASYFADAVHEHLRDHPAIAANPEWRELADKAVTALAKLYSAIGAEHLSAHDKGERDGR
jgi:hypothetical protein